jgi:hypothetical protein
MSTTMTPGHLNKLAALDGFRVSEARDQAQRRAWAGQLAVFRGSQFLFASDSPYRIRAWLYDQARRAA